MQLEDHVGDVIHKARKMNGISADVAATAAGLSIRALETLEQDGIYPGPVDFASLAVAVGLHPQKLERLAKGWLPRPQALNRWQHLQMFSSAAEGITVNSFLAWDATIGEAALFDTGVTAEPILDHLKKYHLQLAHIFITHTHWDHIEVLPQIRQVFPQAQVHGSSPNMPARQRNQAGAVVVLGKLSIVHRLTPGHAEDGTTYVISGWPEAAPPVAVVGDTIFAGSMGNGNGQWALAREKIREEILSLPSETLICPGHGPLTTVGEELENNPFF